MNTTNSNLPTSNKKLSGNKESFKAKKGKEHVPKYKKPHVIIPIEDMYWALNQKPSVAKLWQECWVVDGFGSRWMQLNTSLKRSAFMEAKKVLENKGLFIFKTEKSIRDNRETVCWMVKNLHGARVDEYWSLESSGSNSTATNFNTTCVNTTITDLKTTSIDMDTTSAEMDTTSIDMDTTSAYADSIYTQTLTQQAFPDPSVTSQKHLSNSSKEVLRCAKLSADTKSGTKFADEKLITPSVNPLNTLEEKLSNETSPGEVTGLEAHFEAAKEGIMPPGEVVEKLRNSKYWTAYVAIARVNGWGIEPRESTMTPEARQVMETLKAKKKKPWLQERD